MNISGGTWGRSGVVRDEEKYTTTPNRRWQWWIAVLFAEDTIMRE
jgi:hypothetical protein